MPQGKCAFCGTFVTSGAGTYPTSAPPPPRTESYGTRSGCIWMAGHWEWRGGRYEWVDGSWVNVQVTPPPRPLPTPPPVATPPSTGPSQPPPPPQTENPGQQRAGYIWVRGQYRISVAAPFVFAVRRGSSIEMKTYFDGSKRRSARNSTYTSPLSSTQNAA